MTEQLLLLAVGDPSVQVMLLKLPVPELEKVTVPLGADLVPLAVSVTVAVQVVLTPASTLVGLQLTAVLGLRLLTVTANVALLGGGGLLPPQLPVLVWGGGAAS